MNAEGRACGMFYWQGIVSCVCAEEGTVWGDSHPRVFPKKLWREAVDLRPLHPRRRTLNNHFLCIYSNHDLGNPSHQTLNGVFKLNNLHYIAAKTKGCRSSNLDYFSSLQASALKTNTERAIAQALISHWVSQTLPFILSPPLFYMHRHTIA